LTFAGAAGAADAARSALASSQAKGDRLDAAAGPKLAVAHRIEARVDDAVPFPIAVEAIEALGQGSALVVRGLPDHAGLSGGQPLEPGAWRVDARSAADLTLTLYRRIDRPQAVSVELLAPDGGVLAAASTTLIVEPAAPGEQPLVAFEARPDGGREAGAFDTSPSAVLAVATTAVPRSTAVATAPRRLSP
jgi:hypothetical protein